MRSLAISYWGATALESQTPGVRDRQGNRGNQWQAPYCQILLSHLLHQHVRFLSFYSPGSTWSPVEGNAFSTVHLGKSSWKCALLHILSCSGREHHGEPIPCHCFKYHLCADDSRERSQQRFSRVCKRSCWSQQSLLVQPSGIYSSMIAEEVLSYYLKQDIPFVPIAY